MDVGTSHLASIATCGRDGVVAAFPFPPRREIIPDRAHLPTVYTWGRHAEVRILPSSSLRRLTVNAAQCAEFNRTRSRSPRSVACASCSCMTRVELPIDRAVNFAIGCRRNGISISASNAARDRNSPINPHQINRQRSLIDRTIDRFADVSQLFWVCGRDRPSTAARRRCLA